MTDTPDLSGLSVLLARYPAERTNLIPLLFALQDEYGYVPPPALEPLGAHLGIPVSDILEVIAGYELFLTQPAEKTVIRICTDPVCANAGAGAFMQRLARQMDERRAAGQPIGAVTIEYASCLGLCEHAPAVTLGGTQLARVDSLNYEDLVEGKIRHPRSIVRSEFPHLTVNCGKNQVTWLVRYAASNGYNGLRKALDLGSAGVIDLVSASGLFGRGGGAYPTGMKFSFAAGQPGTEKYVVCNAAEAEPGSYKDRVLLEDDPHRVLEGMAIAAVAIGASKGYLMVRGEYIYQIEILQQALEEAREAGLIGENILGTGWNFDIEIRRCAGKFVSGEETALLKVIEGYPPIPSRRPPYPSTAGLFGKPTVVDNVETLANLPWILVFGADAFRELGTADSPGTKLFCLSGDVTLPGLYEVPFGITLRRMIEELAGGVRGKRPLQAVLFGGAIGTFLRPEDLDIVLSRETLRAAGIPLGSGVITIFDDTRDLRQIVGRLADFFAAESCGICTSCKLGAARQARLIAKAAYEGLTEEDFDALMDSSWNQAAQSICGLGQFAGQAVRSALRLWPDLFKKQK